MTDLGPEPEPAPAPAPEPEPDDADASGHPLYNQRIAILPGDPRIAYRPGRVLLEGDADTIAEIAARTGLEPVPVFDDLDDEEIEWLGEWHVAEGDFDAPAVVADLTAAGVTAQLDVVYFATSECCGVCPPHPALASVIAANPWGANPWGANPWGANPWGANPWGANAVQLNIVATGKPPTSTAMPSLDRALPVRPDPDGGNGITVGILDSGIAGGVENQDGLRPDLLMDLERISGGLDLPSEPINGPTDDYLDPVAGHGTFIAGIIEQLTPGCTMWVSKVFYPEGDVSILRLATELRRLVRDHRPQIVNLSFAGTGTTESGLFERLVARYHRTDGIIFVASAGNEGTCVEQYPAALPDVIGVAALGPNGPAPWSNYGRWVDACAPGTDLVSSFFADFDGALPPMNGLDPDDFDQWATWSGTSFAAPVVVAALARELALPAVDAGEAVRRVVRAPHLARLVNLGTIVNC